MSTISIDWSKAPEGATRYHPETSKIIEHWLKMVGDEEWIWTSAGKQWMPHIDPVDGGEYYERPAPKWSGEGLPPAGVEFESLWSSSEGTYAKAFAIGLNRDGGLVYQLLETPSGERVGDIEAEYRNEAVQGQPVFRPLRSPEQIAAEAREASVKQMMKDVCCVAARDIFEDLYDAGYRKVDPAGAQP